MGQGGSTGPGINNKAWSAVGPTTVKSVNTEMPFFLLCKDFLLFSDFKLEKKISHVTVIFTF